MECKKCGNIWQERKKEPRTCPACHRYTYKQPKVWSVTKLKQASPPINIEQPKEEPTSPPNKTEGKEEW